MAHHEKGQVRDLSFFVVPHPSELVTRQTCLPSFVNLRSKFLPRAPIAKGYGKRQYSVPLQDTEVCRRTPACGKRQYSVLLQDTEVCRRTPTCGKRQYSVLLQDTEVCRRTPTCGIRQYSVLLQDTEVCRRTPACGIRQYSLWRTKRQWDIIALLDSNGEIVIKYTYDA